LHRESLAKLDCGTANIVCHYPYGRVAFFVWARVRDYAFTGLSLSAMNFVLALGTANIPSGIGT
jgi:hypothetical protein